MTFGLELQSPVSHDALLRLHDAEIRLLENIKKCMHLRVTSDRRYVNSLNEVIVQAQKLENAEFNSPMFQAWNTIIRQTENIQDIIRKNAEELSSKTLEKLSLLINEKRASKKTYSDEHNRLDKELSETRNKVQVLQTDYAKLVDKVKVESAKYEDLLNKEKQIKKFEEAKRKYVEKTACLHRTHNNYIIAINEVNLYHCDYVKSNLPGLLNHHQTVQESLVKQSKDILLEYSRLTSFTTAEFRNCQQDIDKGIKLVSPATEYTDFLDKYRSEPLEVQTVAFEASLHDEYNGSLIKGEPVVDSFTVDDLNYKKTEFQGYIDANEKENDQMEAQLQKARSKIEELEKNSDQLDDIKQNEMLVNKRAIQDLEKSLVELLCKKKRFSSKLELVEQHLNKGGDQVPKGLDLDAGTMGTSVSSPSLSSQSYDDHARGSRGFTQNMKSRFKDLKNIVPFTKTVNKQPPKPPSRDFQNRQSIASGSDMSDMDSDLGASSTYNDSDHTNTQMAGHEQLIPVPENGSYIKMTLNPNCPLVEEEWFHGVLPRGDVERLLQNDGDYLVRESTNKKTGDPQYVLSVMWQGHKHFIIQGNEGAWRFEGNCFNTIKELIINQHKSGQPVTNKSKTILKKPIFREDWQMKNDDIHLTKSIGKGNFGEVFQGVYHGSQVAVKTCKIEDDEQKKKFLQEGKILQQYDHDNIVRFIGIAAQKQPIMIVMEYVEGGALLNYLRKNISHLTPKQLIKMCEDAAAGMAYLESKHCIHRDLAARNCLVGKDIVIKISDFGMSREEEEYTVSDGLKQIPIKWTAPEALNYGKYTSLCDVWSYGILMWEIFAGGQTPYPGMSNQQARDKVEIGYRMEAPKDTTPQVYSLMKKCWEFDSEKRPHFQEIFRDLQKIRRTTT